MKKLIIPFLIIIIGVSCSTKNVKNDDFIDNNIDSALKVFSKKIISIYQENNLNVPKRKLAILTFVNDNGEQSALGKLISNNMQTYMFNPKLFSLLERERIDSMLNEFEFNGSGLVSSLDAKQIGKMTGADLILVGTIALNETNQKKPYFIITCRLVDLESGEILAIDKTNIYASDKNISDYNSILTIKNIAGAYKITIQNIRIKKEKADGYEWDGDGSEPDIYFTIETNGSGRLVSNKTFQDTYSIDGECDSGNIVLLANDIIQLRLVDNDLLENDVIGKIIITENQIRESLRSKKPIILSFDQVEHVEIVLVKI